MQFGGVRCGGGVPKLSGGLAIIVATMSVKTEPSTSVIRDPSSSAVLTQELRPTLLTDPARARDLSDGSPRSAMKSGTWAGSTP